MHPAGLVEAFLYYGSRMDDLVRSTGISEALLQRQDVKISYAQQCQLIRNGIKSCGLPGIGLRVGQYLDWCYSGSVGGAAYCSTSLAQAKAAFRRYGLIAQPHYKNIYSSLNCYHEKDDILVYLLRTVADASKEPDLARFELDYQIATTARLYDLCGHKSGGSTLITVGLPYPEPAHIALYQQLPCDTVKFNCARSYIAAPSSFVSGVWRPLRAHLFDRLLRNCESELAAADPNSAYAERVYWCVSTHFHPALSISAVANMLGLSVRALSRRLALEQTSFRNILHHVKMEFVCLHIQYSSLQPEDIAELTGFSSSSSLRRAIKAWRGIGPREVRAHTVNELQRIGGSETYE